MNATELTTPRPPVGALMRRAGARYALSAGAWGGVLLLSAGQIGWTRGWLHLALWVVTFAANLIIIARKHPDVLVARLSRQPSGMAYDKALRPMLILATLSIAVVAGLDAVRYQWTSISPWGVIPGLLLHVCGDALLIWVLITNPFVEGNVRLQSERDHHVIATGPYAMVRHPMYLGFALVLLGIPPILGSWWAFVSVALVVLVLIIRTALEDRFLSAQLPGYAAYAQRTRHRLLPGLW